MREFKGLLIFGVIAFLVFTASVVVANSLRDAQGPQSAPTAYDLVEQESPLVAQAVPHAPAVDDSVPVAPLDVPSEPEGDYGQVCDGYQGEDAAVVAAADAPVESVREAPRATSTTPRIGEEARLYLGGGTVFVGTTRDALDAIIKCSTRQDVYGLADLAAAGQLYICDDNTRAMVLDYAGLLYCETQVRLLDGDYAGLSGWVPSECVIP